MLHSHIATHTFVIYLAVAIHYVWKAPLSLCQPPSFRKRKLRSPLSHKANTAGCFFLHTKLCIKNTTLHTIASLCLFLHSVSNHKSNRFLCLCSPSLATCCVQGLCWTQSHPYSCQRTEAIQECLAKDLSLCTLSPFLGRAFRLPQHCGARTPFRLLRCTSFR